MDYLTILTIATAGEYRVQVEKQRSSGAAIALAAWTSEIITMTMFDSHGFVLTKQTN